MKITLKVQYFGTEDKQDSISVASDLLAAFAMNPKADGISLAVLPMAFPPPKQYHPDALDDPGYTYHSPKVKDRY